MRKFTQHLLPLFLLSAILPASAWYAQNPTPTAESLTEAVFTDSNNVWLLGQTTLFHSVDGGKTFLPSQSLPESYEPGGMAFPTAKDGFILIPAKSAYFESFPRTFLRTRDGGLTWTKTDLPPASNTGGLLRFADAANGWSVMSTTLTPYSSAIARTRDGGATWTTQVDRRPGHLFDLCFTDAQRAWAVGDSGTILATTDGGATWQPQASGVKTPLKTIRFTDARNGWCGGDVGVVLKTADGGATWSPVPVPAFPNVPAFASILFADAQNGFIGEFGKGDEGTRYLRTKDGGAKWDTLRLPISPYFPGSAMCLAAWGPRRLIAAGYQGLILRSDDGGASWAEISQGPRLELNAMHMVDANTGWVAGSNGTFAKTVDGGRHWISQPAPGGGTILRDIQFLSADTGWASAWLGVYRTVDGGKTWAAAEKGQGGDYFCFTDSRNGWGVGSFGMMRRTVDGGRNWTEMTGGGSTQFSDVHFGDARHGIAIGRGAVMVTRDGGDTWTIAKLGSASTAWHTVRMFDSSSAWLAGTDSLYHSEDGGLTWKGYDTEMTGGFYWSEDVRAIHFSKDGRTGAITGERGAVNVTYDGGKTWRGASSGITQQMNAVFVVDASNIWAAGRGGLIYRNGSRPAAVISARPRPRPLAAEITPGLLLYHLEAPGPVRIRLIDMLGRSELLLEARQEAGWRSLPLPRTPMRGRFLEIRAGERRRVLPIR
jgi:photosystem II stability/assembly factor-like uncharacterized protein